MAALYVEFELFCIIILLMLLRRTMVGVNLEIHRRLFAQVLLVSMLTAVADVLWMLQDCGALSLSARGNFWVNAGYYALTGLNAYCWCVYSERVRGAAALGTRRGRLLHGLPFALLLVLLGLNAWTGWLFRIDETNVYRRGPLYAVQLAVVYGYIVYAALRALVTSLQSARRADRGRLRALAGFAIYPLLAGVFQIPFPSFPLSTPGFTLALLSVHFGMQQQLISIDPLTQLNNRNQLIRYLSGRMARQEKGRTLFLLLLDVDHFKLINDRYGHLEGDAALMRIAQALRTVCARRDCFVCRYGGDEFILVLEAQGDDADVALGREIQSAVQSANRAANAPYALTVSIGCARLEPQMRTVEALIDRADQALYRVKKANR